MKIKIILFLTFFLSQVTFSQSDYKISAEGFTFGSPVGNNVKLTIFLSASNIGAVEEFNGQIRNIKLTSRQDNSGSYILDEYRKIIDNDKELNGYSVFSLSYIVPVDASDLTLVLPAIYGSLNIPITKDDYNTWIAKGVNAESSPNSKINASKGFVGWKNLGIGFSVIGGLGFNNTKNSSSFGIIQLGFEIMPKILNFGKKNKSFLYLTLSAQWGGIPSGSPANGFSDSYKPDTNLYILTDGTSKAWTTFASYFGGLGLYYYIGKINPVVAISYGGNEIVPIHVKITDKSNNFISDLPRLRGWGFKIDLGVEISYRFLISYSFRNFTTSNSYSFLEKQHNLHSISFALWGWDK